MTPQQRKILDAIERLTVNHVCPSYEELRLHCGLSSKSEVHRMLTALERDGWITRTGRARSVMLSTPDPIDHMSASALHALRAQIDKRLAA